MDSSKKIQEKINLLFKNNEELRDRLLELDDNAIREIGSISQKGVNPKDIVDAYESNDSETMKYLYEKAKKLVELQKLYKDLCLEYYKKSKRSRNEER